MSGSCYYGAGGCRDEMSIAGDLPALRPSFVTPTRDLRDAPRSIDRIRPRDYWPGRMGRYGCETSRYFAGMDNAIYEARYTRVVGASGFNGLRFMPRVNGVGDRSNGSGGARSGRILEYPFRDFEFGIRYVAFTATDYAILRNRPRDMSSIGCGRDDRPNDYGRHMPIDSRRFAGRIMDVFQRRHGGIRHRIGHRGRSGNSAYSARRRFPSGE